VSVVVFIGIGLLKELFEERYNAYCLAPKLADQETTTVSSRVPFVAVTDDGGSGIFNLAEYID
jgi:hypothetical protein